MNVQQMKKKDFENIPNYTELINKPKTFTGLVIIPNRQLHDSGWATMQYVLCDDCKPICKIDNGSDVIHLDGIGGYGDWFGKGNVPSTISPKGWSIDCLPCGYVRIFARDDLHIACSWGSDLEVYCK